MRISIDLNDNQSWLNWGNLVEHWINNPQDRPIDVAGLNDQLAKNDVFADAKNRVHAKAPGSDTRMVQIQDYLDDPSNDVPLLIMLPNIALLNAPPQNAALQNVTSGPYPLPLFYDSAYEPPRMRANLSPGEFKDFQTRRIGEYVIQECQ
jgi:hypothetical protein